MFEYFKKKRTENPIKLDYIHKILQLDEVQKLKTSQIEKVYAVLLRKTNDLSNSFEPIIAFEYGHGDETRIFDENFKPEKVIDVNKMFDADAIVMLHNHPRRNNKISRAYPSKSDIVSTIEVGEYWQSEGCFLLDHIIINELDYYSFVENNLINIF